MQRVKVQSSNLASVGYDENSNTLEIEFHSSGIYQYFNVPKNVYDGLMSASSHGQYFDQNIKGVYQYKKVS
ncbi:KTSC domain-containing protein [Candidatus Dojkabacteria bacterium]|nr:KTSC domain-containing protein [Candidatus Dojkabacteria bacterium]